MEELAVLHPSKRFKQSSTLYPPSTKAILDGFRNQCSVCKFRGLPSDHKFIAFPNHAIQTTDLAELRAGPDKFQWPPGIHWTCCMPHSICAESKKVCQYQDIMLPVLLYAFRNPSGDQNTADPLLEADAQIENEKDLRTWCLKPKQHRDGPNHVGNSHT